SFLHYYSPLFFLFSFFFHYSFFLRVLHSFPTRRSSDLNPFFLAHGGTQTLIESLMSEIARLGVEVEPARWWDDRQRGDILHFIRSEEHTSELQSRGHLVCRLLPEQKNTTPTTPPSWNVT